MSRTFAALHHGRDLFVLPNAWDVASALLLADAGFPAIATTSLGVSAAGGVPDGTGAGWELTLDLVRALAGRLDVPVTVDLEGGHADDPDQVAALAVQLAELGVAGVNLEDGRPDGTLRPAAEHAAVIAAVASAAPDMFINARTDTYWLGVGVEAKRLADTVQRLLTYRAAGAAGAFVPGLTDLATMAAITAAVALPLNVLWQPGVDLGLLAASGVRRISTGSALYRHALAAGLGAAAAAAASAVPMTTAVDLNDLQQRLGRADPTSGRRHVAGSGDGRPGTGGDARVGSDAAACPPSGTGPGPQG
ncbi:MAG TPA: isocitrate lyase/phosphoenolpyruvate mutase family protein [Euzebya sp.]|nr:isocitrate lyase/phosphoenolpyruvate mutase family protein [Euzebya sp.]